MKKRILFRRGMVLVLGVLFFGMSLWSVSATSEKTTYCFSSFDGNTLYVGGSGPGNYTSIQEAILNTTDGDTVFVFSGTYYEHIIVNKKIIVISENKETTMIDGSGGGDVVFVSSDLVTFIGFTVTNGTNGVVIDNRVTNVTISQNIITGNDEYGLSLSGFCEYNTIAENSITQNRNGTYLNAGSYNDIYGNTFAENDEFGLVLMVWCNENTIHDNNFMKNQYNAMFFLSALNKWSRNYWNRPRILPKPILGFAGIIPMINFDFFPRLMPYQIPS